MAVLSCLCSSFLSGMDKAAYIQEQELLVLMRHDNGNGRGMAGAVDVSGPHGGQPDTAIEVVEEEYTLRLSPEEGDLVDGAESQYYDYSSDEPESMDQVFSNQDKIQNSSPFGGM